MKNVSSKFLERWKEGAKAMQIPEEFYSGLLVRRIEDKSGKIDYPLAVVYNPGRIKRPSQGQGTVDCHMCRMADEAETEPIKNLAPEMTKKGVIVTPNGFPPSEGAVLLISRPEVPMYTSKDLGYLGHNGEFLGELIDFTSKQGLNLYHQTVGAGATIARHEHFHGTTMYKFQEKVGAIGFDSTELKKVSEGVSVMPQFPLAHLVFTDNDPAKIVYFLKRMQATLPSPMTDGSIPHTMSQGNQGILITPTRIDVGRSMGSERAPGYFFVPSREEFDSVNYEGAMQFMSDRFFSKDIGLEKIL